MNKIIIILLFSVSAVTLGQMNNTMKFQSAEFLYEKGDFKTAYHLLKDFKSDVDEEDPLYINIVLLTASSLFKLEQESRLKGEYHEALDYAFESLDVIEEGKELELENFAAREFWMHKNIVVSYFGQGEIDDANDYKEVLYDAYKEGNLPEGLDRYFNFSFSKFEDKNVWGYEYYPELGDPETKGSFSKIVYFIYSTNPDGSDNEQLFRLHVLKFHKLGNSEIEFEYVLTLRAGSETNESSKTLYSFTYDEVIDYSKLQKDIKEVLTEVFKPNEKTDD